VGWEEEVLTAIAASRGPLDPIMIAVGVLGTLWGWLAISLLLGFRLGRREALRLVLLLLIDALVVGLLKAVIARPRPEGVPRLEVPGDASGDFAFPSGHASRAAAVSAYLTRRDWRWAALWGFTALIAYSRLYIGVHWPTDVLAGLFLGAGLGLLASRLFRSRRYRQAEDWFFGRVDALFRRSARPENSAEGRRGGVDGGEELVAPRRQERGEEGLGSEAHGHDDPRVGLDDDAARGSLPHALEKELRGPRQGRAQRGEVLDVDAFGGLPGHGHAAVGDHGGEGDALLRAELGEDPSHLPERGSLHGRRAHRRGTYLTVPRPFAPRGQP